MKPRRQQSGKGSDRGARGFRGAGHTLPPHPGGEETGVCVGISHWPVHLGSVSYVKKKKKQHNFLNTS